MASTLFTASIVLGIPFLFIFLFSILQKRSKQKGLAIQKATFDDLVSANNLTINEKEQFEQYLIGIDTLNGKLLYLNFSKQEEEAKVLDLQTIKSTKADIEENSIYADKKGKSVLVDKHITKLYLELTFKDANHPNEQLTFYQSLEGMVDFINLKKRIEYWRDNINNFVKGL